MSYMTGKLKYQVFLSSGTFPKPAGVDVLKKVIIVGSGAGAYISAAGGGGEVLVIEDILITADVAVTIAAAGPPGGDGSSSFFGEYEARGGKSNGDGGGSFNNGGISSGDMNGKVVGDSGRTSFGGGAGKYGTPGGFCPGFTRSVSNQSAGNSYKKSREINYDATPNSGAGASSNSGGVYGGSGIVIVFWLE